MQGSNPFDVEQFAIVERIASDAPLLEVLRDLVGLIETRSEGALGSVLFLSADGKRVHTGPAPRLPQEFRDGIDGLSIGPEAGSCGSAAYTRKRVIVEDIEHHPYWQKYKSLALPYGLRACWSTPILSPEGKVLGTFAIYYRTVRAPTEQEVRWVDAITHLASIAILRKRTEQTLRLREDQLRAVVEKTPNVAIQWYDERGRLLFLNSASQAILGLNQEGLGQTLAEQGLWSDSEQARFLSVLAEVGAGRSAEPTRFEFCRPDGSAGELLASVFSIPHPELGRCFVAMVVDLTEQQRMAEQLHQAHKLTALGTLASGVAHDFNNVLAAISANADAALLGLNPGGEVEDCLKEIRTACERGQGLAGRILSFASPSDTQMRTLDLGSLITEVLELLRHSFPRNIQVVVDIPDQEARVLGDSTRIHQALMNLISNARQVLTPDGGQIWVELGVGLPGGAELSRARAKGDHWEVRVRDDGPGMDPTTLARAFDPFFTTKPQGEGTGLGLSVVQSIMHFHGGAAQVTSRPGQGSEFRLYFPRLQGESGGVRTHSR